MSSNNQKENQNNHNLNSYFLRTQSIILKGEKIIPFNSLSFKSKYKNKSFSKNKNKTQKKIYGTFTSGNKSLKRKSYINSKNNKNKNNYIAYNSPGGIDLNKVSGSSHFSNLQNYKNKRNIKPNENNGFSFNGNKEDVNIDKKEKIENNYTYYLNNNKNIEKDNNKPNKKIYNSKLYTPFYDLIEKIDKNNGHLNYYDNNMNNVPNNQLLKSNHIIEINGNQNNVIKNNKNNQLNHKREFSFNDSKEKKIIEKNNINFHNLKNGSFKNNNLNNNHQLKIQIDDYSLKKPKEENKTSIMAKTMEFLNKNKKNYNINNINYDYNQKNQNNLNSYINYENINPNNKYNHNSQSKNELTISSNKYQDNKMLTYFINSSTNNNIINNCNNKCKNKNALEIKSMIEELNYSINKNNINRNNEINENNPNYVNNSKTNINNNYNYSLNKNKSFCNYESYKNLNLNNNSNDINSKYFLKSLFDENLKNKFENNFNSFSPLNRNIKYISFSNFDFNNENKEKEVAKIHTPRDYFNLQKNENKLNQLLKTIPTHKKEKKIDEFNNLFSKLFNNNAYSNRKGKPFEEIDNIMPPNILIYQNSNN